MLNLMKKSGKVIVRELAIAFFFASLLVLLVNFTLNEKIATYINLFNKVAVRETKNTTSSDLSNIKIDSETKRLSPIPAYGENFGTINIPNIDRTIKLYNGDSLSIIKNGAGRYIGSFFPGEGLPIIIAAHNSMRDFGLLPKLVNGSKIYIDTYYGKYTYEVYDYGIYIDKDLNKRFNTFLEEEGERILLYTCYPINGVGYRYQRYVVFAKKIEGKDL